MLYSLQFHCMAKVSDSDTSLKLFSVGGHFSENPKLNSKNNKVCKSAETIT